jgi:frataxin-like iron-binding protein CyaY
LERLRRSDNECTGDIVDDVTNKSVKMTKLELGKLVITRRGAVNVIALAAAASCLFRFRTFNWSWWWQRNRAGMTKSLRTFFYHINNI